MCIRPISFFDCEIANAPWRKARTGVIEHRTASILLAIERPIHDCILLALAHWTGATTLTADGRFKSAFAPTWHGESVLMPANFAETR